MTASQTRAPGRKAAAPVFDATLCAARSRKFLLVAAILASAMGFIDGSVVAIALPAMRGSLDASLLEAQWIGNAYLLTLAALTLVGGALADRLGIARVFGAGIAVFVLASVVCAVAPSPDTLIAARALQGIGAAAMVPGSLALVTHAYPREERGRAIGTWAAASALTTAIGPAIGGLALGALGPEAWRLIFAVNLPFGGIALWLLWRHAGTGKTEEARRIDWPGAALATLGLALLAWGLSGSEHGGAVSWPRTAAGVAILAGFILWQSRAPAPMIPLSLFASRAFSAANLLSFFLYFSLSTMLFYLPMTVIGAWGVSPFQASFAFLPLSLFISTLSNRVGAWADRIGPGRPIAIGSLIVAAAYGSIALTAPLQSFWALTVPAMTLAGLGMAFVVAPLSTAVMNAAGEDQSGIASGINNAVTRVAGLIAIALGGALAATVYAAAGGPLSFAAEAVAEGHAGATNAAFRVLAGVAALLSVLSAVTALRGLGAQASSSASQ